MSEMQQHVSLPQFDLADYLRKALREAEIGPGEMADYLGVGRNTVGRYINGHTTPDRRTLMLWALRCGVPLEWLLGASGSPDGPSGDTPQYPRYAETTVTDLRGYVPRSVTRRSGDRNHPSGLVWTGDGPARTGEVRCALAFGG